MSFKGCMHELHNWVSAKVNAGFVLRFIFSDNKVEILRIECVHDWEDLSFSGNSEYKCKKCSLHVYHLKKLNNIEVV